ncbi:hypothetical protein RB195_020130 [Necator americanus]|uniref:Chloride channel protein n=1 Tax=Necator americanus TaxID=51031 RepID=A0ABR1CIX4_NECAM
MVHLLSGKKGTPSEDFIVPAPPSVKTTSRYFGCCCSPSRVFKVFKFAIQEWVFLALLGLIMAVFSLLMDMAISALQEGQMTLYRHFRDDETWVVPFMVWSFYGMVVVIASALAAHFIAPQAIGSGIPEMKTVLRGVILKEYLTIRTLVSKMIALSLAIGSGLPVGKEGPFVHIASVVASQLSRFVHGSESLFENESRANEMLAAGCAVGVACTFSAPVGGVLFSIEVTAVYFAVRSYWRGFFAATCSATLFSVLRGLRKGTPSAWSDLLALSVGAHYQTTFSLTNAFTSSELIFVAAIGLICGITGALFVFIHRTVVLFLRKNKYIKIVLQKYWLVYPAVVSFLISACMYPLGAGRYLGGEQAFSHTLNDFFVNCSWLEDTNNSYGCGPGVNFSRANWAGPNNEINIFHSLIAFQVAFFFLSIAASTLPIAAGIFMPVFVIGGAFGRFVGELLRLWYPNGVIDGVLATRVDPGIYAVVGAAAFCGSVTHTVSVAVIVFELTGQLVLLIPVMIAVLISNAVCSYLQPSFYDSVIKIKHLPYLPDISQSSSMYHSLTAEQFMTSPAAYIAKDSTYAELQTLIYAMTHVRAFPLVENKTSMVLTGSISRSHLFKLLQANVGVKARQAEAAERIRRAIREVSERYHVPSNARLTNNITYNKSNNMMSMGMKRSPQRFTVVSVENSPGSSGEISKSSVAFDNNLLSVPDHSSFPKASNDTMDVFSFRHNAKIWPTEWMSKFPVLKTESSRERSQTCPTILAMGTKRSKSSNLLSDSLSPEFHHTIGNVFRSITRGIGKSKKETDFDLHGEERDEWEKSVLQQKIDFTNIHIDPSPFQMVETTSLFKVHSIFSLLGLKRAYVTKAGRLVGVISLCDLRHAIESLQSGNIPGKGETMTTSLEKSEDESTDDVDYLHPKLEVLTRPNTCDDLCDLSERSMHVNSNDTTIPDNEQNETEKSRRISTSASEPWLVGLNEKENLPKPVPKFTLDLPPSTIADVISNEADSAEISTNRSDETVQRRRSPPHVRIVIPDDKVDDSEMRYLPVAESSDLKNILCGMDGTFDRMNHVRVLPFSL